MLIIKKKEQLHNYIQELKKQANRIGFVPTMGALHQGHISLIQQSKQDNLITVCSIFVNPTQFNDANDFNHYPKTITEDIELLEQHKCDILFLPDTEEMYGQHTKSGMYQLGELEHIWEGKYRPGHFQGVCTIVEKLLNIVAPHVLFLGQKDFQQCLVIKELVELKKINTQVTIGQTVREDDGLAMSSRNKRLSPEMRQKASVLYKMLSNISQNFRRDINYQHTIEQSIETILKHGFTSVDYLVVVHASNMKPYQLTDDKQSDYVVIVAAFLQGVRLIDNMPIS